MVAKLSRTLLVSAMAAAIACLATSSPVAAFTTTDAVTGYTCVDSEEALGPSFGWIDPSAHPTIIPASVDDSSVSQAIGFTFTYMGAPFTTVVVHSNGYLEFGGTAGSSVFTNGSIPSGGTPNNMVAVFWDDLLGSAASSTRAQTVGTAPNRILVVSWLDWGFFSGSGGVVTFQALLYEGSNVIVTQYLTMTGAESNGSSATVGIEDGTGGAGIEYEQDGVPATNDIYSALAIGYIPAGSTPPWAGGGGGGGGTGGFGPGGASRDNDNGNNGLNDLFCSGGAGAAGSLMGLAVALGAALAFVRR